MDNVNNPKHYTSGSIEVIDFIEDQNLGFCLGNAIKYISRAGKKDQGKTEEDLRKAIWYLERQIKLVSKTSEISKTSEVSRTSEVSKETKEILNSIGELTASERLRNTSRDIHDQMHQLAINETKWKY